MYRVMLLNGKAQKQNPDRQLQEYNVLKHDFDPVTGDYVVTIHVPVQRNKFNLKRVSNFYVVFAPVGTRDEQAGEDILSLPEITSPRGLVETNGTTGAFEVVIEEKDIKDVEYKVFLVAQY